jgi:hypothetical protein
MSALSEFTGFSDSEFENKANPSFDNYNDQNMNNAAADNLITNNNNDDDEYNNNHNNDDNDNDDDEYYGNDDYYGDDENMISGTSVTCDIEERLLMIQEAYKKAKPNGDVCPISFYDIEIPFMLSTSPTMFYDVDSVVQFWKAREKFIDPISLIEVTRLDVQVANCLTNDQDNLVLLFDTRFHTKVVEEASATNADRMRLNFDFMLKRCLQQLQHASLHSIESFLILKNFSALLLCGEVNVDIGEVIEACDLQQLVHDIDPLNNRENEALIIANHVLCILEHFVNSNIGD